MVRKGCNSLVRAEKILTHIAWVGMASYMELLNKFQYPKSSMLNRNDVIKCDLVHTLNNESRTATFSE